MLMMIIIITMPVSGHCLQLHIRKTGIFCFDPKLQSCILMYFNVFSLKYEVLFEIILKCALFFPKVTSHSLFFLLYAAFFLFNKRV